MSCPVCGREVKSRAGLSRHLSGGARYVGHELSAEATTAVLAVQPLEAGPTAAGLGCVLCGKSAKTERGLRKHLTGTLKYGGHELPKVAAASCA